MENSGTAPTEASNAIPSHQAAPDRDQIASIQSEASRHDAMAAYAIDVDVESFNSNPPALRSLPILSGFDLKSQDARA